jgi:hypothetical protein
MAAAFLSQMLTQQLTGARIEKPHIHRVPLHIDLLADPTGRCSVVRRLHRDTTVQMNRAPTVLVVAERFQWQRFQRGLLFSKHGRYLPFGSAMDTFVGPAFFPVIEISLRFGQTLEGLTF